MNTTTTTRAAHLVAAATGPIDSGQPGHNCDHDYPHAPYPTTVLHRAMTITRLLTLLTPQFGKPGLSTRRAIGADEVRTAYSHIKLAKRRVRVYSSQGFVPQSYRGAEIQYVEATRGEGGGWTWRTGWGSASRRYGQAKTVVVE